MDIKYKKYKYKYNKLKNQIGSSLYESKLKELYPQMKQDNISLRDKYTGHSITYGEMEYDGLDMLLKELSDDFNYFIDIGSGRGKLPMYMAKNDNIEKAVGIELVAERHDDAVVLKEQLKDYNQVNKVELINEDVLKLDLTKYNDKKSLVWISNLCMGEEITDKIYEKIINELAPGSIITSTRVYNSYPKLREIKKVDIPMTWNNKSSVTISEII